MNDRLADALEEITNRFIMRMVEKDARIAELEERIKHLNKAMSTSVGPSTVQEGRCLLTSNPCGTDTWPTGNSCQCDNCKAHAEYVFGEATKKLGW
jgi:hypothetical protein